MKKKMAPLWLKEYEEAILEVLPESQKDLGGPLNVLRYGEGSNLQYLGTIYRLLGEEEKSRLSFMEASFTFWPYESRIPPEGWENEELGYLNEEEAGYSQIRAAICSFLAGEKKMANQLFTWARGNIDIPKYALDFRRPGSEGEHENSGKVLLRQAYIEARLGQFDGVIEKVTEAKSIFTYFFIRRNKRTDMEFRYQCEILKDLAEYKLHPTEENKDKAQIDLEAYKKACPKNFQGIQNFFYILDLQEAFPKVFNPVLP